MLRALRGLAARTLLASAPLLMLPTVLEAHAIHTTLTVLTATPSGVSLNIRAFADDFSASVAKFSGRAAPADSSAPESDVVRYVRAQVMIRDASGKPIVLESCGVRRAAELYWLCFRAALPAGAKGVVVRNRMLTEYHADQVNIVQIEGAGARRTMLFTKASAAAPIS